MADFPKGIFFKAPPPNAPDFVKGKLSMKREDAIQWLQQQQGDWVNLECKVSREGKGVCMVDDWKPQPQGSQAQGHSGSHGQTATEEPQGGDFDSDIPFMRLDGRAY